MPKKSWVSDLAVAPPPVKRCLTCAAAPRWQASIDEFVEAKKAGTRATWAAFWRGLCAEEGYPYTQAALRNHVRDCMKVTV